MTPSLTESLSWSLHAPLPHSQPSQIPHAAPDSAQNSLWGPFPILTAPTSPLQLFLQPHKVENTVAELWSPWPCRDRALCLAPCLLSWPQDTLLCPVTDIIRLVSCRMGPAQIPLYQTTTVQSVISRTLKFWRTDFHMK